ncbi:Rha family transcriptional regulator [Carnobacterium divergens]|uniref:Rha family transcriptional regulator n=1 Tax=Carnobacterium divergens TaxID=2748 RepID=UPI0039AED48E
MQTHKLERTITSMEVASMVDRPHADVLKDIRKISGHLTKGKSSLSDYFINSNYEDITGRTLPCFDVTKKGCELYGTRMTGEKGTLFAIEYIERFNEMETTVKQLALPTDPMEILQLTFEAQKQANEKLENVDTRVTELEENAPLSPGDYGHISRLVNQRVLTVISERHLKLTQKQRSQLYKDLNAEIKAVMRVPSRTQLRQRHYNDTIDFILNWQPSSATIAIVNQLSIEEFTDIA